jgi:hypothetical protein
MAASLSALRTGSYSRISQRFLEFESSLTCSQKKTSTASYPEARSMLPIASHAIFLKSILILSSCLIWVAIGLLTWRQSLGPFTLYISKGIVCLLHGRFFERVCRSSHILWYPDSPQKKEELHGLSPRANYTDRATAACRLSNCQLLRIEGATWSAWRIPIAVFSVF